MENKSISTAFRILAIMTMVAPSIFGVFATLRVSHIISWSWWIVSLPLWGTALIILSVIVGFMFIILASRAVITYGKSKKGGCK